VRLSGHIWFSSFLLLQRLKQLQAESPDKHVKLRVEVEGGGCSGFQYKFRLDDNTAADDM
jgi:Fe-S cluster assembly iron-binding protein IscA